MKIAVSGKGGAGKTTISGTITRALARAGQTVIAIDADVNPMLGISLGLGMDGTERLAGIRQKLSEGSPEEQGHEHTAEGLIERFGSDAPDGVRIVVASRVDLPDHGCLCCGTSADRLLGELEGGGRTVLGDLEASARDIPVLVFANKVASDEDLEAITAVLGEHEVVVVPEDPVIARADADGLAPIDLDAISPGVRAITAIADRLVALPA